MFVVLLVIAATGSGRLKAAASRQQPSSSRPFSASSLRAVLDTYCVSCHNQRLKTAGLALDTVDLQKVSAHADVWEKVLLKLRMGVMPPAGKPRPDKATTDAVVSWLQTDIDRAASATPDPGRTEAFHRLNRTEYQNAIRDLLAIELDVAAMLPADHATYGLDNIAEALSVSPALMEGYMSAARKISRLAVGLPPTPAVETYRVSPLLTQDAQVSEDLPFGSRGGVALRHYFPVDGEYVIKIRLRRQGYDYIIGLGDMSRLDVRIDGVRVKQFTLGGESHGNPAPVSYIGNLSGDPEWEDYALHADEGLEVRLLAKAGLHVVGVSFVEELTEPDGVFEPVRRSGAGGADALLGESGAAAVDAVSIGGPYRVDGPGDTPSRRKIFVCRPKRSADEEACAERIVSTLARRAYRRPVAKGEVQTLLGFYKTARSAGSFDAGIQFVLERILDDPDFLFRVERDPARVAPGTVYRLSDLELASRLSFFLWSSIPDDVLLDLAVRGTLHESSVLNRQVRRMLADPRSKALVDNFFGQWLELRNLRTVTPDPGLFPRFDDNLRHAFQRETELFVDSQIRGDRSVLDLLSANYTFVNERLARHYGIPDIFGDRFQRITVRDDTRRGLLGQGSILTVTSYPNRTSPVLRGKWVLDNILGTPPPMPPPDVPALKDKGENGELRSVRERLEDHRKNPACASCHAPMDPLGFALENFDAVGQWRARSEAGTSIDASGAVPSGAHFEGPAGLRMFLMDYREQFVRTVAQKLLAYALGRAVDSYDLPALRAVIREAAPSNYRWSSMIVGIVESTPFRMRRSSSDVATTRTVSNR